MLCYVHRWYAEKNCFMGAAEGFDVSAAVSLLKRYEMHTPSIKQCSLLTQSFFVDDNVSNKLRQLAKGYEFSALLFTYTLFIFSLLEYSLQTLYMENTYIGTVCTG